MSSVLGLHSAVSDGSEKTSFQPQANGPSIRDARWVKLTEEILTKHSGNKENSEQKDGLDEKIKSFQQSIATLARSGNFDSLGEIDGLADNFLNLHESLSINPVSKERPHLSLRQQKLAWSSIAVERERYPKLSFQATQIRPAMPVGANRYFSQVAFLKYLDSEAGLAMIQALSNEMQYNEKKVFNESILVLKALAKDYLKILSSIEAVKHYLENAKEIPDEKKVYEQIEKHLLHMLGDVWQKEHFVIPLGWSFSAGLQGHHMLLFADRRRADKADIQIVDTAVTDTKEFQCSKIDVASKEAFTALESKKVWNLEGPHPLCTKKCSQEFRTSNMADKINQTAKILMLQIPSYTQKYRSTKIGQGFSEERLQALLHKINYSLVGDDVLLKTNSSSVLEEWNWFPASACAFASFQPLLQILALRIADKRKLHLTSQEEINLQHYFELLLHSHKLFLLKKFQVDADGSDKLKSLFTSAVHHSIAESGEGILKLSEPKERNKLYTINVIRV